MLFWLFALEVVVLTASGSARWRATIFAVGCQTWKVLHTVRCWQFGSEDNCVSTSIESRRLAVSLPVDHGYLVKFIWRWVFRDYLYGCDGVDHRDICACLSVTCLLSTFTNFHDEVLTWKQFPCHQWFPHTRTVTRSFDFFMHANGGITRDLRRHGAHVMSL